MLSDVRCDHARRRIDVDVGNEAVVLAEQQVQAIRRIGDAGGAAGA